MAKSDNMRARILEEFNRQMYIYGYDKTTLRAVCDVLDISTGHLYYYFKKKEDIYIALTTDLLFKLNVIINEHLMIKTDGLEKLLLLEYAADYLAYVREEVNRINLEGANYPSLMEEVSCLVAKLYWKRIADIGYNLELDEVKIAVCVGYSAKSTLQRLYNNGHPNISVDRTFEIYHDIIFRLLNWGEEWQTKYKTSFSNILSVVDMDLIIQRVYEMDQYDYAEMQNEL